MKRHFYTLLLATALSLPAAGAFATGMPSSSNTGSSSSVGAGALGNSSSTDTGTTGSTAPGTTPGFGAGANGTGTTAGTTPDFGAGADFGMNTDNTGNGPGANNRLGMNENTGINPNQNTTNISPGITSNTATGTGTTGTGTPGQSASAGQPAAGANVNQPATVASGQLDLQEKLRADNDQVLAPQELSSADVRGLQGILQTRGYYQGNIDGLWGPRTAQALQSFQSDFDLERTGRLDARTVNRLSMLLNNNAGGAGTGMNDQTNTRMNGETGF